MPVTLEDIAKASGYSRSTVSRVINGGTGVSERTRKKIASVVEQLNYHPNQAARGLAAGQMNNIGFIIPETVSSIFTDPYFQYLSLGISQTCNEHDFSVMLWLSEPDLERKTINNFLNNGLIDGVIIASIMMGDPILEALMTTPRPFVLIGQQPSLPNANFVDLNNIRAGYDAVQHLFRLGHQRIATITGPSRMVAAQHRFEGYRKAMEDANLSIDNALIVEGDFTQNGGYTSMKKLLKQKPDAVFIASDIMAIGAYRACQEHSIAIPEDIAIVGFDDIPSACQVAPRLTTMRQPIREMGSIAAATLIEMINHQSTGVKQTTLPAQLIVRESSGTEQQ